MLDETDQKKKKKKKDRQSSVDGDGTELDEDGKKKKKKKDKKKRQRSDEDNILEKDEGAVDESGTTGQEEAQPEPESQPGKLFWITQSLEFQTIVDCFRAWKWTTSWRGATCWGMRIQFAYNNLIFLSL